MSRRLGCGPVEIANIDYVEPQVRWGGLRTFVILGLIARELEWLIDRNDSTYLKPTFKLSLARYEEYLSLYCFYIILNNN